jgi:hypothetical protein
MAVKLPTRDQLGPLPTIRSGSRGRITPHTPNLAVRTLGEVGQGVAGFGRGISQAGDAAWALHLHQQKKEEFETEQRFQEFDWNQRLAAGETARNVQPGEATALKDTVQQNYQKSAGEFFSTVPEHLKASYEAKLFERERGLVDSAAEEGRKKQFEFATNKYGETVSNLYAPRARVSSTDDLPKVIADSDRAVDENPDFAGLDKSSLEKLKRTARRTIEQSHLDALPPEQRQALIGARLSGAASSIEDKIVQVESGGRYNAKNSMSSASGPGQFIEATWLDMIKRNRPDVAEGRTDREILALRTDPQYAGLSKEMVGAYARENTARLQQAGIQQPTPGQVYLAHFLGPEGAAKVLTADPRTPVANLVTAKAFNANRSVMDGKTAGDLAAWSDRKMGGVTGTFSSLTDDDWKSAQTHTDAQLNARRIDANNQLALARAQQKQISDDAENDFVTKILKSDPSVTASAIADSKELNGDGKRQMLTFLEHVGKTDRSANTYGSEFFNLFQRIHAPEGDPNRLTDPRALYDLVKPGGGLTLAGMEKLRTEMAGKRTPEGEAEGMLKKQFFANARSQITGSNEGLGMRDPRGDDLYQRFMVQSLADYEKGRKEGKSASVLLNPDSPDYIGKSISSFKRPMDQWFAETIQDRPAAAKPFDPATVTTLEDLKKAHNAGMVDSATARAIAIERGWAAPRPQPASLPQVPRGNEP